MNKRKEPVAGDLDASAQAMATFGLRRAEPAFAGAVPSEAEIRTPAAPPPRQVSNWDLWLAVALFGAAFAGLSVYLFVR